MTEKEALEHAVEDLSYSLNRILSWGHKSIRNSAGQRAYYHDINSVRRVLRRMVRERP